MALTFTTVQEAATTHGVKILVYGSAGAGKTRLCGTAPKPLIISAEAGLLTYKKMIAEGLIDPKTPVVPVTSIEDVEQAYEWCVLEAAKHGIQTLCLDSISEIAEKCLAHEKGKTKDPRQAFGEMALRIVELVKKFRDISGMHVIVTAKQTQIVDAITGVQKATPTSPGQQIGPALPYLFDEVLHAFTDKEPSTGATYHALRTRAAFNVDAKDRSGMLDEIEYPDATNLINKIMA